MARKLRSSVSGNYCHVINRAVGKATLFTRPRDYRAFLDILGEGLERHPVPLIAFCVLSNHWHLVLGPSGTPSLSRLLHWVTTTHAVRLHRHRGSVGEGHVYQGRFKAHLIEEAGGLVRVCRYVERNALTAGVVRRAQDWPWGSLAERRRPDPALPLSGAEFLGSDAWVHLVNAAMTPRELALRPLWLAPGAGELPPTGTGRDRAVENRPDPLMVGSVENLGNFAEAPGGGAEGGEERGRVFRRADGNQAHTHVERPKHLRVLKMAGPLKPREQRRNRPTPAVK
jgi:putative transposase